MSTPLICPVCRFSLQADGNTYRCAQGHSFDKARQGYLNVLLSHQKHSRNPGDNKAMVAARHAFLAQGHYLPIYQALEAAVLTALANASNDALLQVADLGCGEGYYTRQLDEQLARRFRVQSWGVDISKEAILSACKQPSRVQWLVGTLSHLPFADASMDVLYALFCPLRFDDIVRVLKPGGLFVLIKPGPRHLLALREVIYPRIHPTEPGDTSQSPEAVEFPALELISRQSHQGALSLNSPEDIATLFKMTPHYWRSSPESHQRVAALHSLNDEIDIEVLCYQRSNLF